MQSWPGCIIITSALSEEHCGVRFLLLIWLFITNVHRPLKFKLPLFSSRCFPFRMMVWFLAKIKGKSYQNVFTHRLCAVVEPVWLSLWFGIKPSQVTSSKRNCTNTIWVRSLLLPIVLHHFICFIIAFFHHSGLLAGEIFLQLFYLFSFYFAIVASASFGSPYIETLFFFCKNESRCKRHKHTQKTLHKTAKQLKCG